MSSIFSSRIATSLSPNASSALFISARSCSPSAELAPLSSRKTTVSFPDDMARLAAVVSALFESDDRCCALASRRKSMTCFQSAGDTPADSAEARGAQRIAGRSATGRSRRVCVARRL